MAIDRAVIIAANPATVARLVAPIARAGIDVESWGYPGSRLAHSRFVRRHHQLATRFTTRYEQLAELAASITDRDWVILGTDHDLQEISDLVDEGRAVRGLLPVAHFGEALRDKLAMAATLDTLDVTQPRWRVAPEASDVHSAARDVGGRAMAKTVRGWGGLGVTPVGVNGVEEPVRGAGPYQVQEWVDGEPRSVDLFTVDGNVAIAPYSRILASEEPFGISISRRYVQLTDEQLMADLQRISAGFGGTWFANVTAIRRADGSHMIVEVDLRPNSWHAYLGRLGYPLNEALRAVRDGRSAPIRGGQPHGVKVANLSRALLSTARGNAGNFRYVLHPTASWRYAHRGDVGLTLAELRSLARASVSRSTD